MAAQTERPPLTAHIETWTGQDVSIVSMTHEVVSRLLLGAVEVVNGDTEDVRAHHAVGAAGQTHPVQCPVQRAGEEAELRAQRARGCKTGAYTQDRVLRGDHCYIWVVDKHTGTHWYQLKKPTKKKLLSLLIHLYFSSCHDFIEFYQWKMFSEPKLLVLSVQTSKIPKN